MSLSLACKIPTEVSPSEVMKPLHCNLFIAPSEVMHILHCKSFGGDGKIYPAEGGGDIKTFAVINFAVFWMGRQM